MTAEPLAAALPRDPLPLRWLVALLVLVPLAGWLSGWLGERSAMAEVTAVAAARADLYRTLLLRELDRPAGVPLTLSQAPLVGQVLRGQGGAGAVAELNHRLADLVHRADLTDLYVMDRRGLTLAASNSDSDTSFVGKDFSFRAYFVQAVRGEVGHEFALGATSGVPGYYLAQPVEEDGAVIGVVVAKIELARLERLWADNPERLLLADADGKVLLTDDPALRFQPMPAVGPGYYALQTELPGQQWRLTILTPTSPARNRRWAWAVMGGVGMLALLLISYAAAERRRGALAFAAYEREARARLEEELKLRTAELVQAAKLATIGQMATGMVHEINQPLAAIRSFAGNAQRFMELGNLDRVGQNLTEIAGQVDRLATITHRLKGFARRPDRELAAVPLTPAVERVLAMVGPRLREQGVTVDVDYGLRAVAVRAEQVRLEQVLLNLLTNALDAMKRQEYGAVFIRIEPGASRTRLSVADTGPGIAPQVLPDLFEPFTTTKVAGEGLGLGLSIAAAILRDFGGTLTASNRAEGGAVFTLDLATAELA